MSELALQLIHQAKERKSEHLDLGNCDLKELPEELFELTWLKSLSLGIATWEISHRSYSWQETLSKNTGAYNKEIYLSEDLAKLTHLQNLQINGRWGKVKKIKIHSLEYIAHLTNLRTLSLGSTSINNIDYCTNLNNLEQLLVFGTNVKNVEPLRDKQKLRNLILGSTSVEDVEPLRALTNLKCLNLQNTKVKDFSSLQPLLDQGINVYGHPLRERISVSSIGLHLSAEKPFSPQKSFQFGATEVYISRFFNSARLEERRFDHILTVGEAGFSMLDIYSRHGYGVDVGVIRKFADKINDTNESGSLFPSVPISAIPRKFFRQYIKKEEAILKEFRSHISDFLKINLQYIKSEKLLIDFRVTLSDVPSHYINSLIEELRINPYTNQLERIVIAQ